MKKLILFVTVMIFFKVMAASEPSHKDMGMLKNYIGKWKCVGSYTELKDNVIKNKEFVTSTLRFFNDLGGAWLVGEYEDLSGYKNRCHYSISDQGQYQQVCLSSTQAFNTALGVASDVELTFTGEVKFNDRVFENIKVFHPLSDQSLNFNSKISDENKSVVKEFKSNCVLEK